MTLVSYHSSAGRSHETFHGSREEAQGREKGRKAEAPAKVGSEDAIAKEAGITPRMLPGIEPTQATASTPSRAPTAPPSAAPRNRAKLVNDTPPGASLVNSGRARAAGIRAAEAVATPADEAGGAEQAVAAPYYMTQYFSDRTSSCASRAAARRSF